MEKSTMYIKAVYNETMRQQIDDEFNMFMALEVIMDEHDKIFITERYQEYDADGYSQIIETSYTLGYDPVAVLCFEHDDYMYFHCYAVGREGNHLSYQLVEKVDIPYELPGDNIEINYSKIIAERLKDIEHF